MKKSIIASLLIACSLFIGGNTDARAEYPYDKPINIIVPFGPGGGVDIAARILADYFQQNYNITINVVNKPGGAQAIGINEMLRARPDAYDKEDRPGEADIIMAKHRNGPTETFHLAFLGANSKFKDMPQGYTTGI